MSLLGLNQQCPCGTGKKYKKCCRGNIDWEDILKNRPKDAIDHLTVRGRNLGFLNCVDSILDVSGKNPGKWEDIKNAMTPKKVRDIAEAITVFWPRNTDIELALQVKDKNRISALHLGSHQDPEFILNAVARHAMYADKILIFDPLIHPLTVKPEYSSLHNPSGAVFDTLKHLRTWYALAPWIEAGIVEIIRGPSDFDRQLKWDLISKARNNTKSIPNYEKALETDIENLMNSRESKDIKMLSVLGLSDAELAKICLSNEEKPHTIDVNTFIQYVRNLEKKHPYFIDVKSNDGRVSQLTTTTSGASYTEGSMVASITNSYLFTDLRSRWIEIQNDRKDVDSARIWDPFSKAFSEAKIPSFQDIPIEFALQMRNEGRMESLRTFLRQIWKAGQIEDFDNREATIFADQFKDELKIANFELSKIDSDLIKWVGAEGLVAALASTVTSGEIIPVVGWAVAAAAQVTSSTLNRRNIKKRYPAAMFLNMNKK